MRSNDQKVKKSCLITDLLEGIRYQLRSRDRYSALLKLSIELASNPLLELDG